MPVGSGGVEEKKVEGEREEQKDETHTANHYTQYAHQLQGSSNGLRQPTQVHIKCYSLTGTVQGPASAHVHVRVCMWSHFDPGTM